MTGSLDRSGPGGKPPVTPTIGLAMVMTAQSVLGLVFPGQYRDVEWIKAAWFGNDWVTLTVAVPLLIGATLTARGGSTRALLLWMGVLGYAAYNYAFYLFGAALNVFFPLYVAGLVGSWLTLIVWLWRLDVDDVGLRPLTVPFARAIGGYFATLGFGLASVWLALWAGHVFAGRPTPIEPEAFKLVAALDLSMMVPALVAGGALLWRRQAWGTIVSAIAGTQGSMYLLVLSVNAGIAVSRGLVDPPGELPVWGTLMVLTTAATLVLLTCAGRRPPHVPFQNGNRSE